MQRTQWITGVLVLGIVAGMVWYSSSRSVVSPTQPASEAPPERAVVKRVLDPMTIELESGHIVRYIGVRTPDVTAEVRCFGKEALLANESIIGKEVRLETEPLLARSNDGAWTRYVWLQLTSSPTPIETLVASPEVESDQGAAVDITTLATQAQVLLNPAATVVPHTPSPTPTAAEASDVPHEPTEILINERILEGGFGFPVVAHDMKYGERMLAAARFASATGKGLWSRCQVDSQDTPQGTAFSTEQLVECVIKGKVTSDGTKLYRTPECPAYRETIPVQADGGAWFCAEDSARDAGFDRAPDCEPSS